MLALALAACNNDNENLNGAPVAAQFTADIAPATRASGTTWTGGDRIGITDIGNDSQYGNVPFILKNGKFEAEGKVIYIEDTKAHTFRAYYPYNAAGGILAATTDATAQQNQSAIDFLFATGATGDKKSPVVSFTDKTIIRKSKCSTDFKRNDFLKKTKRTHWVRFVHLNSLIESCVFLYLWNSPFDTFL